MQQCYAVEIRLNNFYELQCLENIQNLIMFNEFATSVDLNTGGVNCGVSNQESCFMNKSLIECVFF